MTELYSTVQSVIKLMTPLIHEVSKLQDRVTSIREELMSISNFLDTAEERAEKEVAEKEWVRKVRRLAYDIEDVVEEYYIYQNKDVWHQLRDILGLLKMGKTIESIQERAVTINRTRQSYHMNDPSVTDQRAQQFLPTEQFDLVGVATPKKEIIGLLGLHEMESRLSVVAVVGAGGVGKTAIVESVYKDELVNEFFPTRAWIHVPQSYSMVEVLRSMLLEFQESAANELKQTRQRACSESNHLDYIETQDVNNLNQTTLQSRISKFLEKKRYLIVFDDVQDGTKDLIAHVMTKILPTKKSDYKGSKIIVMTRYENVGRAVLQGPELTPYMLKPLPADMAWELFCKKTFENDQEICPSNLVELAGNFVKRCNGRPSYILGIGSILSTKQNDLSEWNKVHQRFEFYLTQSSHFIECCKSSKIKYASLPVHLKPCLLYFGMFPRDWAISPRRLVRLWIAEGFVTEGSTLTLEETAEEYLQQLIKQGLVSVENPKTLRVFDDFLWEIIRTRLEELSFCHVVSEINTTNKPVVHDIPQRRLCIHDDHHIPYEKEALGSVTTAKSSIRSLISLVRKPQSATTTSTKGSAFWENLHLLKVLELCDPQIQALPEALGKLLNLHYLNLSHTQIRALPKSIGKLQNLQTLELKHTQIRVLPTDEINSLSKLRYLIAYCYEYYPRFKLIGVKIPKLWRLTNLQKLAFLDVSDATRVVEELRVLTQLRRLGITGLRPQDEKHLCHAIREMTCLESLSIYAGNTMIPHLESITCPQLKRLYLSGGLKNKLPNWISELHSLAKIRLRWSRLIIDPLEILQDLNNLAELQLLDAYDGHSLRVRNRGFPKLKILELLDLRNLVSFQINKEGLPLLEQLSIGESPKLKEASGLQYITTLSELKFYNMPRRFADSVQVFKPFCTNFGRIPRKSFYFRSSSTGWVKDTSHQS